MKLLANQVPPSGGSFLRPVEITTHIVENDDTLLDNYRSALKRKLPTLHIKSVHDGLWVIVGSGPSLKDQIRDLKKHKRKGHKIIAVNGAHDYLIKNGVIPDYMAMVDPKESNIKFVKKPNKEVCYLIGACCHPSIFDALEDQDLKVWYPINGAGEEDIIKYTPVQIGGGTTIGLRAINIGYVLGYRNIHMYGMEGCLKEDEHHAFPQPENDHKQVMDIHFLDKVYYCHVWMAKQAENFIDFMKMYHHDMNIHVHSDGILKHIANHFRSNHV